MLEGPWRLLAGLPRTVRVLLVGTLVNKLGSFIFPFLSLVLSREFRLSPAAVAGLLSAYGIGSLVSIVMGGVLTDTLGRRRTLLVSLVGGGCAALAMGFSSGVAAFLPLLLLFAFLNDLYRPASSALISDLLPSSQRAVGYAGLRVAVNLGFFVGMALGGVLVDWSWRFMFVADGLTTLACALVVYLYVGETRPLPVEDGGAVVPSQATPALSSSPWSDRTFLQLCLATFVFALAFFADFTIFPLTITGVGYPAWVFGVIVGLNGLAIAAFEISATAYLRRFRRLRVAALGALVSGLGFGITGVALHWAWFLFAAALWTAGEILMVPQQMAFAADWAPPLARGRYLALQGAMWSLAAAVSPIVLMPLHARLGDALFWPLLLLVNLPSAWLFLRLDRRADRPELLRGHTPGE